ncbi:phosphate regulon sensor histidine kinase PhoR [Burkholderia gladioli]|jgi:two-component system phosphate regulon sensor histidine kinase PhoR|uniref:Phosphate regulon sensor protein PhoR n=1 Tax=Burkholderia gladioli TaxID=28095 RepID=A0AAP1Y4W1_BURGA|nr:phosphate regulon sensor histidine kinase PhoR [Burkholderia gladioli]AJW99998.1 phosphate regulon sensor kinase PhoR [Burkholderia gladioli]ASD78697.1 phosphate regulon sensor histidine kinase PhoR [Burkholderia gladioli pv. gladioli]AWY56057.1 phosphate regulon sensor histidine kinase PhoR [Burkholderia gladioli pv. gladioli]KAF1064855.1 Phosphate regulon sensor protein PhoR [Burkholderia gladioli]KGC10397.1 phosphate regulon sensor kinase PhoR [Burkholderia gladioli]
MNIIWARFLVSLVLLALVATLAGATIGVRAGLAVAVVLLVAQAFFSTFHTQQLWRLLDAPVYGEVPSAPGIWGEIYYRLHKLAKQWHAQVRQVEQQHSRFIQAIQASPNGVAMLDDHDQIEWCNAIAELHFGLDAKRDLRQHITHLVRHPDFVRYLNAQHYDEMLVMRGMGEGRQHVIAVQVFPYGDNRKLLLTQDITEVERTDAMRRDFVANVSHELKTPLTVLSGFLETLRELPLSDEERARYLDMMEQQAGRMRKIVTDLLVLAKLEGEGKPPTDKPVDMDDVLGHLEDVAQTLSAGHHEISFEIDDTLSVTGAETEIFSALGNLVTNAVRYTPEGGKIRVCWRRDGSQAVFSVKDSGFGIPAEDLPRLTERFYRVDRSRSRDTGGTGLGLAIVKHVLQRHDGQLLIQSEEGRGSTFTARFPAQRTVVRRPRAA